VYAQLSAGRPGLLGAMTARAEAQVMRLACLYALGDRSTDIKLAHLQAALDVWRYCFDSARYIFGDRLGDPTADEIRRALRVAGEGGLTRSEILYEVFQRNRQAGEITKALDLLEQCRLARMQKDDAQVGGPAERWFTCEANDRNDRNDKTSRGDGEYVVNVVSVVGSLPPETASEDDPEQHRK
jgi:hypothetical protein